MSDLRFPEVVQGLALKPKIEAFWRDLEAKLPDEPLAVYLAGSALWDPQGEARLLLVLGEITPAWLALLAGLGKRHGKAGVRAPILITPEHLERARDVFALEFFDLGLHRASLRGPDPLAAIELLPTDLRAALEREARLLRQRLGQAYIEAAGDSRVLGEWLLWTIADLPPLLRVLAFLKGREARGTFKELTLLLRDTLGPELADLESLWQARLAHRRLKAPEAERLFAAWMRLAAQLIEQSDGLRV